jgi:hypothetical protein
MKPSIMLDYAMPRDSFLDGVLYELKTDLAKAGYEAELAEKDPRTAYASGEDITIYFVIGAIAGGFFSKMGQDIYEAAKKSWGPVKKALIALRRNLSKRDKWFRLHFSGKSDPVDPASRLTAVIHVYDWKRAMTDDEWEAGLDFFSKVAYPWVMELISKDNKRQGMIELIYENGSWTGAAVVNNEEWIWLDLDVQNSRISETK